MAKGARKKSVSANATKKVHPWRMCPLGQYWVSAHPLRIPSRKKSSATITTRRGHCRTNPSRKDQLYPDEIHEIAHEYFSRLRKMPSSVNLGKHSGKYDRLIAGWTKYWNEVLVSSDPLDMNAVKALISTESDFLPRRKALASKGNWARGLMQITDETVEILKNEKGELKDFLINLDQEKVYDPVLNICAGIRWLFHKKKLLEHKLKRKASWEEAVMEYKSYTQGLKRGDSSAVKQKKKFLERYEKLIK